MHACSLLKESSPISQIMSSGIMRIYNSADPHLTLTFFLSKKINFPSLGHT